MYNTKRNTTPNSNAAKMRSSRSVVVKNSINLSLDVILGIIIIISVLGILG
jgi:hypothetical protein